MLPVLSLSGSVFPLEMMPRFLQTVTGIPPRYDASEERRASRVFVQNMTTRHSFTIRGIFAAVVFVVGRMTTKWAAEP